MANARMITARESRVLRLNESALDEGRRMPRNTERPAQRDISIIEDILAALISPEAVEFSVEQLARDYGYPDVGLGGIDADSW